MPATCETDPPPASTASPPRSTRVIHSVPVWLPATQTWLYNQTVALPESVESHVVCESTENLDVFALPRVHSLADGSTLRLGWDKLLRGCGIRRYPGHLPTIAEQIGAHVLHSHFGHIGWCNLGAARRIAARHVVTFYGQDLGYLPRHDPRFHERYRRMFAEVDRVLCEGPHMAQCVVDLGCPDDLVRVHRLGVDLDGLPFVPRVRRDGEPFRVLMSGSFTEKKGIPDGLRALARIQGEVELHVTLIGDANDQARNQMEKQRILATIAEHRLGDRVELRGYQPHGELMKAALAHHVFLSPSVHAADGDTEGGAPVTILEMSATGMPVVSTRHCDIPAVVRDGESGLLADEHDVEGLAGRLLSLAEDPAGWDAMGRAGRQHVEAHYDMRRQGEALAEIYRGL